MQQRYGSVAVPGSSRCQRLRQGLSSLTRLVRYVSAGLARKPRIQRNFRTNLTCFVSAGCKVSGLAARAKDRSLARSYSNVTSSAHSSPTRWPTWLGSRTASPVDHAERLSRQRRAAPRPQPPVLAPSLQTRELPAPVGGFGGSNRFEIDHGGRCVQIYQSSGNVRTR